jgi:hypothetical protein
MNPLRVELTTANNFDPYRADYQIFLKKVEADESPAAINMGNEDNVGFLFSVNSLKRWTNNNGEIALLYDNLTENIVGVSAVETLYINSLLGSGGNRCWLLPAYRSTNEITTYLLNANFDWCKQNDKVGMVLTFNDHNKWIYDTIKKLSTNSGATLGTVWSKWWNDCIVLPHRIRYFNTRQWAIIKPINRVACLELAEDINSRYGVRDRPFIQMEKVT